MFEKEAEEYAIGKGHEHYNYLFEENAGTPADFARWCFEDGAEFGYNKANEWHYVKDGKYPAHSNRVLVFTDEGVGFGLYGLDNKKWYTYDTGFDVIAWKEITLPALPKEIKEK